MNNRKLLILTLSVLVCVGSAFAEDPYIGAVRPGGKASTPTMTDLASQYGKAAVKPPVIVSRVEPVYTETARKANFPGGLVVVEITVTSTGAVTNPHVLKPLPFGLSDSVVTAIMQWGLKPATVNGHPVDVIFNLTLNLRGPGANSR